MGNAAMDEPLAHFSDGAINDPSLRRVICRYSFHRFQCVPIELIRMDGCPEDISTSASVR